MPIITVEGPTRDIKTKRKLVKEFTDLFKKIYGFPEGFEHVTVIIRENSPENVGVNGELLVNRWKK